MKGEYYRFLQTEGVPIIEDYSVDNLEQTRLSPSKRRGGLGAYLNLGYQQLTDGYLAEAPPNGSLNPERHLYEELVYVINGKEGHTILGYGKGEDRHEVKWKKGSVFAIPLNCFHQHFNDDSDQPARVLFYSNFPTVMGALSDTDVIFNSDVIPKIRKDALPFSNKVSSDQNDSTTMTPTASYGVDFADDPKPFYKVDYIYDIRQFEGLLRKASSEYYGFAAIGLEFPSTLRSHISLIPPGHYGKAHRHGGGAYVNWLSGSGYSLFWEVGKKERNKITWKSGSVESPPAGWFHQHLSTGKSDAFQMAFKNNVGFNMIGGDQITGQPIQLERADEDPRIKEEFEREIALSSA